MNTLSDFMLPPANSVTAAEVDPLFNFINVVSVIFLIGITIAIIVFCIKYRRRSDDDVTPLITHHNGLEILWSVIPLILVMITFAWGYTGYLNLATPPGNAYEIHATARMYSWEFRYPNGQVSVGQLHVPVNRPVKMIMSSDDLIHSFYVPDFRVKMDVLPNRYTSVWFEALETGEAQIYCAEYCGTGHSAMLATVVIHPQEEFADWLESGGGVDQNLPLDEQGQALFTQNGCTACHSTDGSAGLGPTLQGLFGSETQLSDGTSVTADENYIRQSILEPQAQIVDGFQPTMPVLPLDDQQIDAVIEYLKTLN